MSYAYNENLTAKNLPLAHLMMPIERASTALCRLDERLIRSHELAAGYISRSHYLETCANIWMDGELVHLKDLVLHDMEADVRPPTHELTRAAHLLHLRRKLFNFKKQWAIDRAGLFKLINRSDEYDDFLIADKSETQQNNEADNIKNEEALFQEIDDITLRSQTIVDQIKAGKKITSHRKKTNAEDIAQDLNGIVERDENSPDPISQWIDLVEETKPLPAVLGAAILLDAWLLLKPIENSNSFGRMLCAYILQQRLTGNLMPPIIMGLQKSRSRWQSYDSFETRITIILNGFEIAGHEAMAELDRLGLARERMMLSAKKCRSNSSLPGLIEMFIQYPIVSTASAAKKLGITPRAVDQLLKQLGPSVPRERTGRGRYRMWGVI